MANGVFTITELVAGDPSSAGVGERFEWTADRSAATRFNGASGGGARACPFKPWIIGGSQRNVRTDYPNAATPSYQIMGPVDKPQEFSGRWDDRFNGAGYAKFEMRRFLDMCRRGNPVRVQYDDTAFEGIITDWQFDKSRSWKIGYQFTLDVAGEPAAIDRVRVPPTPNDPISLLDDVDLAVQAMLDADQGAPRGAIAGSLADNVTTSLVESIDARESLALTIDQQDLLPPEVPVDGFLRMATQFRAVKASAMDLTVKLASVRADIDLSVRTAMSVLDFEIWSRTLRYMGRIVTSAATVGDKQATERAEPGVIRVYRPQAGEHLYAIARKFYGTPHAWELIYTRNALQAFTLTGDEILIIPERGGL